jgi:hypothetical protein
LLGKFVAEIFWQFHIYESADMISYFVTFVNRTTSWSFTIFRLRSRLSKRTRAFEPLLARFLRLKSPRRVSPSAIAPRRSGCGRGLVPQNAPTPRGSRALVAPDARHCPKLASVRTAHRARIRSAGRPTPSAAGPAPGKEALPFPSPFRV